MKYRTDRVVRLKNDQLVGYAEWMGGPTVSRVTALCPDGYERWAHVTGEPDTWFSLPAYVNNGSKGKIFGHIQQDDGLWVFIPTKGKEPNRWITPRPPKIPAHLKDKITEEK